MRFVATAGVSVLLAFGAGCSAVDVKTGIPVLTKGGEGILIDEAQGLPDLERGKQARLSGNPDAALKDLQPLAEQGYPEAMMQLAGLYQDRGTIASLDDAEKWYRQAKNSIPEAGLSLATLLINRADRQLLPEINALIRNADRRGNPEADSVRLKLLIQFPDLDVDGVGDRIAARALRSDLPEVQIQALIWYRQNIARDGYAAALETNCAKLLSIDPACYIDLAHFYRYRGERDRLNKLVDDALAVFQAGAGDSSAPRPDSARLYREAVDYGSLAGRLASAMVDEMTDDDDDLAKERQSGLIQDVEDDEAKEVLVSAPLTTEVVSETPGGAAAATQASATQIVELADKILRWMLAKDGGFRAEAAIVAVRYPFLLPELDLEATLRPVVETGDPAATQALANLLFNGQRSTRKPYEAVELYKKCLTFIDTKTRAEMSLGRVYQLGILGNPDPVSALDYYLRAGRAGSVQAYIGLARMFSGVPGIRPNRVNTYVFARRAQDGGRSLLYRVRKLKRLTTLPVTIDAADMFDIEKTTLLDYINSEMSPQEREQAKTLYDAEKLFQPVLRQPVPPDIYTKGRAS
ncbi:MAG: hypothetical protein C0434_01015 [Xanthomonadaceae bacterium]|nr:hypothetical protein [Xanthomonadaceae bacterium]